MSATINSWLRARLWYPVPTGTYSEPQTFRQFKERFSVPQDAESDGDIVRYHHLEEENKCHHFAIFGYDLIGVSSARDYVLGDSSYDIAVTDALKILFVSLSIFKTKFLQEVCPQEGEFKLLQAQLLVDISEFLVRERISDEQLEEFLRNLAKLVPAREIQVLGDKGCKTVTKGSGQDYDFVTFVFQRFDVSFEDPLQDYWGMLQVTSYLVLSAYWNFHVGAMLKDMYYAVTDLRPKILIDSVKRLDALKIQEITIAKFEKNLTDLRNETQKKEDLILDLKRFAETLDKSLMNATILFGLGSRRLDLLGIQRVYFGTIGYLYDRPPEAESLLRSIRGGELTTFRRSFLDQGAILDKKRIDLNSQGYSRRRKILYLNASLVLMAVALLIGGVIAPAYFHWLPPNFPIVSDLLGIATFVVLVLILISRIILRAPE